MNLKEDDSRLYHTSTPTSVEPASDTSFLSRRCLTNESERGKRLIYGKVIECYHNAPLLDVNIKDSLFNFLFTKEY